MAKKKEIGNTKKEVKTEDKTLSEVIIEAIQEKKGIDIVVMDLSAMQNSLFDQFIICSANSKPQSDTIIDHVAFTVKKQMGLLPKSVEGTENGSWSILDYFNVIVHVFDQESRTFYQLEKLWADAKLSVIETV